MPIDPYAKSYNKTTDPEYQGGGHDTITYKDAPMPNRDDQDTAVEEASPVEKLMAFAAYTFHNCLTLARKKNADYAGADDPLKNFRRHGSYGVVVRLDDKICRLATLLENRKVGIASQVSDESLADTCDDVAAMLASL